MPWHGNEAYPHAPRATSSIQRAVYTCSGRVHHQALPGLTVIARSRAVSDMMHLHDASRLSRNVTELQNLARLTLADFKPPTCAPAHSRHTMAAIMSLNKSVVARSAPAARRPAVRVQAFQVTLQTPSGCKKFEAGADKNLLEVRWC